MVRCSFAQVSASIAVTLLAIPRLVAGQHPGPYGTTIEVLDRWIDETDATLNFAGAERGNPMNPFDLRIIWCSERRENVCGGTCTVFTGAGDQCLRTMQSTACLAATRNVRFCADERCESPCNIYTECGVRMDSGFCVAPFTRSIQIGQELILPPPRPQSEPSGSSPSTLSQPAFSNTPTHPPAPSSSLAAPGASTPPEESSSGGNNSLPVGAIAGIVLGVLFMIGASICAVLWLRYKTRRLSTLVAHNPAPPPRSPPRGGMPVSSPPMHSPYATIDPPIHQYQRSLTMDYDMDSIYTSNPGYPVTMSSISYASAPSVAPARAPPASMPSPAGTKGHDRVLRPVNRDEEEGEDVDDSRSFGHYLVNGDRAFNQPPHRVDSAEVRPHYTHR